MKGNSLLKQVLTDNAKLTTESPDDLYATNEDVVINLNSENTSTTPVEGKKEGDDIVDDFKETNTLEEVVVMSGAENLKNIVDDFDKELKDNIIVCDVAEETVKLIEVGEVELKSNGTISTETALSIVNSYNKLQGLLPGDKLKDLSTESAIKYPREIMEITRESADSTLERIKKIVIEIIQKIVEKIKKMTLTVHGLLDNVEKATKEVEGDISKNYTDVVVERFEDKVPFTSIRGRLAMIADITKDEIVRLINFGNRGASIEELVKTYIEDVKKDKLDTIKSLFFTQNGDSEIYRKRLQNEYKDIFKDCGNFMPLRLSGTEAIVLCSRINDVRTNDRTLVIKEFKIELTSAFKDRMKKIKENKDTSLLLTRADLLSITQALSKVGREQRDSIKTSLAYLDKVKVAGDVVGVDSQIKNELPKIVSVLTRAVFTNAFSGIFLNRLVLGLVGEYIGIYERQNQTKK